MRLLWLSDVLRGAGLTVHEVAGWRTRGADSYGPVRGVIIHETRGSATSTDAGEIGVLVNGRPGLSGPIAQLYLSRTGDWHVVASGTCHHVLTGWGGYHSGYGNDALVGIEPAHAAAEDWTAKPAQYGSYVRGVAAILANTGWPVAAVVGHKEHQPGDKPDPEFDMTRFRADVARTLAGDDDMSIEDSTRIRSAEAHAWAIRNGVSPVTYINGNPNLPTNSGNPLWDMLRAIAAQVDVDADELAAITAAARAGAEAGLATGAETLADRIADRLITAEDNPLGEADKPAIMASLRAVLGSLDDGTGVSP